METSYLKTLELDKIIARAAEGCVCKEARAMLLAIEPQCDPDEVRYALEQTDAINTLLIKNGSPRFGGVEGVSQLAARAVKGGVLSMGELLMVAGALRNFQHLTSWYGSSEHDALPTDDLFYALAPEPGLEQQISSAILAPDAMADTASRTLAELRKKIRATENSIRDRLESMVRNMDTSKYLQESVVSMRNGRYVVPVKSEYRGEVSGIIHDVSSTGATVFVEPQAVVEANARILQYRAQEAQEIERILAALSAEAASFREGICHSYEMLVQLDCIFARARLSHKMDGMEPEIRTNASLELVRARHPLIDRKKVVPVSLRLGSDFDTLIITGPNTGGKTVTLKTIGLLTLMAECGLHIPADHGSAISVFRQVLADIGDEQSIEQSLSTFSAHMKNIVDIVADCDRDTLVLFDELGAGTDPAEGAALANALIEFCRQCGSRVAATTHYAELKLYAMRTEGVMNASCEFDVETLRPTYRLLIGIPGKSNAFAISRRLGLPDSIIDKAKSLVNENDRNFEDVLNQLEQQRQQMEAAKLEAERLRQETEQMKEKSEAYYAEIKREREKAVRAARAEAQSIIDDARRTSNEVADELKKLRKQLRENADVQGTNAKQTELRRRLNEAEDRLAGHDDAPKSRPQAARAIRVGDTVELVRFGTRASVLAINKDGSYLLQAGIMKVTAQPDEVYLIEETKQQAKKIIERSQRAFRSAGASTELDLRGMSADEAIATLDIFLDNAMMANLASVRIIHGKGTGVLRKAVQDELKRNRCVKRYRLGVYGEGEDGVTIAELA